MCAEVTGYSILQAGPHHKPKHVSRLQGEQTWVTIYLVTLTYIGRQHKPKHVSRLLGEQTWTRGSWLFSRM